MTIRSSASTGRVARRIFRDGILSPDINLVTAIQQEFKIKFALGELEQLKNVGDLLDLMERKIDSKR